MPRKRFIALSLTAAVAVNLIASLLGGYPYGIERSVLSIFANQLFWLALCFTIAGVIARSKS